MNQATFKTRLHYGVFVVCAFILYPSFLPATAVLKNDLLKLEAVALIEEIGKELQEKTGVYAYVIATNEHFPPRFNLVSYSKKYENSMHKPYVVYIFAPYAAITEKSEARGRVGIIPSSKELKAMYHYEDVRDAGINIVAIKDSNTDEDKFNIGVLQAYSVLSDHIAESKGVTLTKTIPDEMGTMVRVLRVIIYSGTAVLFWIFVIRPYWRKKEMENNKKTYWPHMIVGFLVLALTLSYWTVKSASSLPVQEVNDYMMKYQQADIYINDILEKKSAFDALYTIEAKGIQTMAMSDNIHSKLPQPEVVKLLQGKNRFRYRVQTKEGKTVEDAHVSFLLTRPHTRVDDVMIENVPFHDGAYTVNIDIQKEGRYTLQLRVEIDENTIGYLKLPAYLKP